MFAVIFEVKPTKAGQEEYLSIASDLRNWLKEQEGFISIERFQSLNEEGKMLSLSFWENEQAIKKWRNLMPHRLAQKKGQNEFFDSYRIRVAEVVRDYSHIDREQAPNDSIQYHKY
jgi:heme-degrading monooxygenase HmoA